MTNRSNIVTASHHGKAWETMLDSQFIYENVHDLPKAFKFLQQAPPTSKGVLSAFLDTSTDRVTERDYVVFFQDSTRAVRAELARKEPDQLKVFDQVVERLDEFLRHHFKPHHPGLALYASVEPDYFLAVPLPSRPSQDAVWSQQPVLEPLIEAMDEYEHIAVALVDQHQARIYVIYLGAIELYKSIDSGPIEEHPLPAGAGGIAWSGMLEPRQRRKHERAVMKHLQRVAQALMQMLQKQPFDRLFLAGTEEVVDMLRDILPRPLRARYAESLRLPVSARESEVLAATIEASERHERAVEVETVERLIDRAGAHTAVLGLEETLAAIFEGRVDMLVMSSDLNGEVGVCGNCGRLTTSKSTCPACGSQIEKVVDLRERVVSEVLDQSGRIEIVEGPAAEMLGRHGGVGAFLRF